MWTCPWAVTYLGEAGAGRRGSPDVRGGAAVRPVQREKWCARPRAEAATLLGAPPPVPHQLTGWQPAPKADVSPVETVK